MNVGTMPLGRMPNWSEVPGIAVCRHVPTPGEVVILRVLACGGKMRPRVPTCGLPHIKV